MYRYVINDRDHTLKVKQVFAITTTLSALLIIFSALSISPFFGKFMAEQDTTVMVIILALVLSFQIILGYGFTRHHIRYNNINTNLIIFYILLLSSVISSIEVSLVSSQTAVIITFILCYTTVSWFVFLNMKDRIILAVVLVSLISFPMVRILRKFCFTKPCNRSVHGFQFLP